ncbi:hypothetical protein C8Q78DRAFT_754381 [Trametes maxima]|nr:hypothetical protein C8Q78DRAFT_754381 [Trametes maxima]
MQSFSIRSAKWYSYVPRISLRASMASSIGAPFLASCCRCKLGLFYLIVLTCICTNRSALLVYRLGLSASMHRRFEARICLSSQCCSDSSWPAWRASSPGRPSTSSIQRPGQLITPAVAIASRPRIARTLAHVACMSALGVVAPISLRTFRMLGCGGGRAAGRQAPRGHPLPRLGIAWSSHLQHPRQHARSSRPTRFGHRSIRHDKLRECARSLARISYIIPQGSVMACSELTSKSARCS